jgi:Rod binding domain-containing protein
MSGQIVPMPATPSTDLPADVIAKLRGKAEDFEAATLGQLLEPMFDTVDSAHGLFGGGDGEQSWRPMLVSEMAKQLAHAGGIGLAQPVLHALIQAQEAQQHARGQGGGQGGGQPTPNPTTPQDGDAG